MHSSWEEIFNNYPKIDELNELVEKIDKKRLTTTIYPPKEQVFRVFDLALEDIKVVILGQDPYHNPGQACGLSFSVNDGVPLPKSLINIYKEPLGVVWYLYTLWALYLVYGFLSIFIKNKNYLFMISILGYIITLVYMSEIFFIKKVLAWGVIFMLGSVLKTVKFNDIRFRNIILLGIIFNIVYISLYYISHLVFNKTRWLFVSMSVLSFIGKPCLSYYADSLHYLY